MPFGFLIIGRGIMGIGFGLMDTGKKPNLDINGLQDIGNIPVTAGHGLKAVGPDK